MNETERMKELVKKLNEAAKAYYQEDREIMSNYEYDKLYDALVELEKETGVTLANSSSDGLPGVGERNPFAALVLTSGQVHRSDHRFNKGDFFIGKTILGIKLRIRPRFGKILDGNK